MNPDTSRLVIERVANGFTVMPPRSCDYVSPENIHVFRTPSELANFIHDWANGDEKGPDHEAVRKAMSGFLKTSGMSLDEIVRASH